MLPDLMTPTDGETRLQTNARIRAVALEKIVSATAIARINRALGSTTTAAGDDLADEPGELLDHLTVPPTADETGWQGPAEVLRNLTDEGLVEMRWKGQKIRRKYGDVRRFMDVTALTYGYHTQQSTPHYGAVKCLEQAISNMPFDRLCVIGFVQNNSGWHVAQNTRSNQSLAFAIEFAVSNVFHATGVIAARVGKGIRKFSPYAGATSSTLLWWQCSLEGHSSFETSANNSFMTKNILGEGWKEKNYVQLLMSKSAGIDLSDIRNPDLHLNDADSINSQGADASGRTSEIDLDRLSTIDEESDAAPEWFNHEQWSSLTPKQKEVVRDIEKEGEFETVEDTTDAYFAQNPNGPTEDWNVSVAEILIAQQKNASQFATDPVEVRVIAQPEIDTSGNAFVAIDFPQDSAKLIADCPTKPGQSAELSLFTGSKYSMVYLEEVTEEQDGGTSYDDLTGEDYAQYSEEVRTTVRSELETWVGHTCFNVIPCE